MLWILFKRKMQLIATLTSAMEPYILKARVLVVLVRFPNPLESGGEPVLVVPTDNL